MYLNLLDNSRATIKIYNKILVNDKVSRIIKFAIRNMADVVVCEFLNFKGKKIK